MQKDELRKIITDVDELGNRADEIDARKDGKLVQQITRELKLAIRENNLTSLSAPQIGYGKRVMCINFSGDIRTFVNPVIVDVKGFGLSRETCSSLPGKTFIRPRNEDITVTYQTPMAKIETRRMVGYAAKVFQHCIDHLDGLLLSDVGLEIDEDFDKATEDEKAEVINAYLDALDIKKKDLEKEILENPELKQMDEAIDFISKLSTGEVHLTEDTIKVQRNEQNG